MKTITMTYEGYKNDKIETHEFSLQPQLSITHLSKL